MNTGTSLKTQFAYTEMSGGINNSRITAMTYPNDRVLHYGYAEGER